MAIRIQMVQRARETHQHVSPVNPCNSPHISRAYTNTATQAPGQSAQPAEAHADDMRMSSVQDIDMRCGHKLGYLSPGVYREVHSTAEERAKAGQLNEQSSHSDMEVEEEEDGYDDDEIERIEPQSGSSIVVNNVSSSGSLLLPRESYVKKEDPRTQTNDCRRKMAGIDYNNSRMHRNQEQEHHQHQSQQQQQNCRRVVKQESYHSLESTDTNTSSSSSSSSDSAEHSLSAIEQKAARSDVDVASGVISTSNEGTWMSTQCLLGSDDSDQKRRIGEIITSARFPPKHMSFDQWLQSKKRIAAQEARQRRCEAKRKAEAEDTRRKISEKCYAEWLANKQQQQRQANSALQSVLSLSMQQQQSLLYPSANMSKAKRNELSKRRLVEWERKKLAEQQRRRDQLKRAEAEREERATQRHNLAKAAWEQWLSQAHTKPLPVPMNRGIASLAGSLAPMYVNPRSWQHLRDEQDETSHQRPYWKPPTPIPSTRQQQQRQKLRQQNEPENYTQPFKQEFVVLPLSIAQRALQSRLNDIDGVRMQRRPKWRNS